MEEGALSREAPAFGGSGRGRALVRGRRALRSGNWNEIQSSTTDRRTQATDKLLLFRSRQMHNNHIPQTIHNHLHITTTRPRTHLYNTHIHITLIQNTPHDSRHIISTRYRTH
ncbi:hypothetical protein DPMN_075230 [Dreissena polymorpha]|uniref:Uncharacterized protein n=1 Tax=Dreissena polymorpha TaxID=45954 RepID=A0A9D3YGS5_DREPO|nr:hypothetical protein DPMN_075230 [Dreissena polymorpha]